MDPYLQAIKDKVCMHCIDADSYGNCRTSDAKYCTIELNYKRVVKAIQQTNSGRYEDYISALRENVCSNCNYGASDDCVERDTVECPLDRYLPLVVDAVEGVRKAQFA